MTATTPFPKKQHYIPQFYLKNFSKDGEHIYIYDKEIGEKGEIRYQTTIDVAHENHFYTFRTKKGSRGNLEEFFSGIEGDANTIIEKIYRERKITEEEKGKLALFVAFLLTRVPAFKNKTEAATSKIGEKVARMWVRMTPKERIRKFYREKKGKELTDKELDDIIDFGTNPKRSKITLNIQKEHWIRTMLKLGVDAAGYFAAMDWLFLFTDQPFAFITSDNPFFLVPPEDYDRFWGFGLLTPKTRKVISLRSNMCLMMGDMAKNPQNVFADTKKEFFRAANQRLTYGCERFCFSPDQGKIEKLVKEVKPYLIKEVGKIEVD